MKIASIDVGIKNLALTVTLCNADHTGALFADTVVFCQKIDVVQLVQQCERKNCSLQHTNMLADRMAHFTQQFGNVIRECQVLLIEQQPITGLTGVEQLIAHAFRDRAKLISPRAMHKHFGVQHLDYEDRKRGAEAIACELLRDCEYYQGLERKHDVADAMCMTLFYLHMERERLHAQLEKIRIDRERRELLASRLPLGQTVDEFFTAHEFRRKVKP